MKNNIHTITRLYVPNPDHQPWQTGLCLSLSQDSVHHLRTVLRYDVGQGVRLFDGIHGEWLGVLESLDKKKGTVLLQDQIRSQDTNTENTNIHIAFAPLKKTAQDIAIEKSVELGVNSITLIQTDRTNVNMGSLKEDKIVARMVQASQQCERLVIPDFMGIMSLETLIHSNNHDILYCAESGVAQSLSHVIETLQTRAKDTQPQKNITLLVGPEGGFTPDEFHQLEQCPFAYAVSLGPRILRAETAIIGGLSVVQSIMGDWGKRPPRS